MKRKGFTLIELLVVIAIIAMLLAILMPALNKVKKIAQRVVCGTNLKGLGTAQTVYANDYEDQYTLQGDGNRALTWADVTDAWQNNTVGWDTRSRITVGASLYLLVREADVSPKSFVCPASTQIAFDGKNALNLDLVELYDFGSREWNVNPKGPQEHVSYSFQQPYQGDTNNTGAPGQFAANATKNASFAVMADRSPYYDPKIAVGNITEQNWIDRVALIEDDWSPSAPSRQAWEIDRGNAQPHDREGQNVTYGDGHSSYETRSDVGERHDNIYTPQDTTNQDANLGWLRRGAGAVNGKGSNARARSTTDSFLVGDDNSAP